MNNLNEIAKPIWNMYCSIYPQLKSFEMPELKFDGRIKAMLAYSYFTKNVIRISKKFWPNNEGIYKTDIIPHELAHQIAFNLYGVEGGHDAEWMEIMLAGGFNPEETYEVNQ